MSFVAGDIFQSIFDAPEKDFVEADFLLNKCYRTDPKTLMFSHALGMNLFENEKQLRWLEYSQWEQCGYHIEDLGSKYKLNREPVRRFEGIDDSQLGVTLINHFTEYRIFDGQNVINIIQFFSLDFDPIGKTEVIKAIGVFIPPLAGITVYF